MKQKKIWLLSGLPGSGKSTWAKTKVRENGGVWCSRDQVRFALVREDEEYFSREDEVFEAWINMIRDALMDPNVENIYVDATHLNDTSRYKTLRQLSKENICEVVNVIFTTPIEICIERNNQRTGREVVPETVIRNMAKSFKSPAKNRDIYVNEKGEEFDW